MICHLCGYNAKSVNSLGKHIHHSHKDYSKKKYYDKFISTVSPRCVCGKEKKFRGLGEGYRQFCSISCRSLDTDIRNKLSKSQTGKKQSKETIQKRLQSTDQKIKETTRKKTMLEKYGVENPIHVPDFLEKAKVKSKRQSKRTKEHSEKIISAKRKNGTLTHTSNTQSKIIYSLNRYYQEGDNQNVTVSKLPSNGRGHKTGYHKGILYRSSYELAFIIFCERNNIKIESCENKERRVRYECGGKKRWYYPDFYLTDHDICVEIKPTSMMNELFLVKKHFAEKAYKNFVVVTENELSNEEKLVEHLLY
jgi:hypothetical protein